MCINISIHWNELKVRLAYFLNSLLFSTFCFFFNGDVILYIFVKPFLIENLSKIFIFTNVFEGFISFIFISIFCSVCATVPFFVYLIFGFYKIGLVKKEADLGIFFLKNSMLLSAVSFLLTYYYFFPLCIKTFLSFEQVSAQLYMQPKIFDYLELNVLFFIGFLLLFNLPIILSILIYSNFILLPLVYKNRRILILGCLIAGCVCSPPDIFTQLVVAMPLWLCTEVVLLFNFIFTKYHILNYDEGWLGR
jgi:sec-independent protein translocase protein TatC